MIEINSMAGLITVLTGIIGNAANRNANINDTAVTVLNGIFSFDNLPTDKRHARSIEQHFYGLLVSLEIGRIKSSDLITIRNEYDAFCIFEHFRQYFYSYPC